MALLVDIGDVPACHCDDALEGLFKALSQDPHGDAERSIWNRMPNPWIAQHAEDLTARLQRILEALQDAFSRALTGESVGVLAKAEPWERWDPLQFEAARLHLEAVTPSHYTLDDWLMLVDWLISRYLPDGVIKDLGDYLAVRSYLAGKVQAAMDARADRPDESAIPALALLIPTDLGRLPERALTPREAAVLDIASKRAALHISDVTQGARAAMKVLVIEHTQAMILGHKDGTPDRLRARLFDAFGKLNRDFRRIAVTETGEVCNSGFVASLLPGARVRRIEAYQGACDFCRSINGKVFEVVDPAHEPKDGDTQVWVGKTNVGRSASPRKRVGGELVDREPEEMWWAAAGVMHPNCRGAWTTAGNAKPPVDPEFTAWMNDILAKHTPRSHRAQEMSNG